MAISLGIHAGHDRGACIIKDGEVLAAIAQERIDQIKHSPSVNIPYEAIDKLLEYCNIQIQEVSCIGFSLVAIEGDAVLNLYKQEFFAHYNCNYIPFYFVSHHDAHAYSVYYSSGFDDCLVFVADGGGDFINNMQESETMYIVKNGIFTKIDRRLQNIAVRHMKDPINHMIPYMPAPVQKLEMSLARKYSQITNLLGFQSGEEGKTMGLASYGSSLLNFDAPYNVGLSFSLTYADMLKDFFCFQYISGMDLKSYIKENRADIAKTVQDFTEKSIISIVNYYIERYHIHKICFVGGIFLNCLTNHKVLEQCNIEDAFFLPASGDDGQALGCAYYAYAMQYGWEQKYQICLPYLGLSYSDEQIIEAIQKKNLKYKYYDDFTLSKKIAKDIAENKIIAIHRGRSEIGPRALCHRSIIANPSNPEMKDILNSRVKHRENFRPFAPTVTEEDQYKYFNLRKSSEYMLLATLVKPEYQSALSSVTHVDNTARVQAVSRQSEPFIYSLLKEVEKETGYPVVLNTSFNVAGKPMVESPLDTLNTFLGTDIDILVIGNYVIEEKS